MAMTVGPWQIVALPSTSPPSISAISMPTDIASVAVSLPIKKNGRFAFTKISAALSIASLHGASFPLISGAVIRWLLRSSLNFASPMMQAFRVTTETSSTSTSMSSQVKPHTGHVTSVQVILLLVWPSCASELIFAPQFAILPPDCTLLVMNERRETDFFRLESVVDTANLCAVSDIALL